MTEPRTAATVSNEIADASRELNYQTRAKAHQLDGLEYPGDVYTTVANLKYMAQHLPQALDQLGEFISQLSETGHLKSDKDTLDQDVADTMAGLSNARRAAKSLAAALNQAHSGLSPLAWQGAGDPPTSDAAAEPNADYTVTTWTAQDGSEMAVVHNPEIVLSEDDQRAAERRM
jgi:hypothetical protein